MSNLQLLHFCDNLPIIYMAHPHSSLCDDLILRFSHYLWKFSLCFNVSSYSHNDIYYNSIQRFIHSASLLRGFFYQHYSHFNRLFASFYFFGLKNVKIVRFVMSRFFFFRVSNLLSSEFSVFFICYARACVCIENKKKISFLTAMSV